VASIRRKSDPPTVDLTLESDRRFPRTGDDKPEAGLYGRATNQMGRIEDEC
jgi:hypothetical protein